MDDETTPKTLLHICARDEWEAAVAAGEYRAPSLAEVGFIHLSEPYQVHLPANRLFAGRTDMALLRLDPERLGAPVKWEPGVPTDPESMRFPHLYGPLPISAVVEITAYRPGPDGLYSALADS
ncbi:DUF952 domain-containing protein [Nocardia sp. SYP-A9097]|uniref:DUF952 domain-containing protein n=1 Tax=Nocardia sp. SYP-A9097 TaxID=2663237 RepID=UPI001329D25A|nr:DUF952 domain-containing protein [Nocardia sp. SYP-A9097]MRH89593.1 DUF952 domain-containing protein [Nocardia sp. SYP-A9097]